MAMLVYSDKCKHCYDLIEFIKTKPALHSIVTYQHVHDGVPPGVSKVPSLVTSSGQIYVGKDVKEYLYSLVPNKIERFGFSKTNPTRLDHQPSGKLSPLSSIGKNNQAVMTRQLEQKISQSVTEGLQNLKR